MKEICVELQGIKKSFNRPVLRDINLRIQNKSYISIEGKSGSGKSTLMNILGLVESFDEGSYMFNNENITNKKDYSKLRLNNIGFIFQSYNLIPSLTCRENIMLPLMYAGRKDMNHEVERLAEELDIMKLLDSNVNVLSGGEKQRVAIARALILNPSLIIADEPTGNLDEENKNIVFDLLHKENEKGRAIVMITHDPSTALQAKTRFLLKEGCLYEQSHK